MAQPRVLILDTPGDRLPLYRAVLDEFDAETVSADSAATTLSRLLQDDYALILVNLTAPAGDTPGIVRHIRANERTRHTPILLIGTAGPDATSAGLAGPVDWIGTPVDGEAVRSRIRLLLELQRRVTQAEQLSQLKDELLSSMSHELRTPLNAIFGWITLLRSGRLDAATAERALETIERNARSQKVLIDDLLDMSRVVSGQVQLEPTQFDPREVVESALQTVGPAAATRRIALIPELPVGAVPVRADLARLKQAVCALLSNAIKFTPEGGRVWIRMDREAGSLAITVTDTGQGISAQLLPHLFDWSQQQNAPVSRRRSGLGLVIVRQLAQLHGGSAAASSPGEGQGATFTIRIPAPEVDARSLPPPRVPEADWLHRIAGLTVLVVDDDAGSREVVASMLQGYGAHVTTVETGERALSLLMRQPPDVLIADLAMPQMNGIDLIQRIRALRTDQGGQVPAIAVSAFAQAPDRLLALQAGFDSHLPKPVEAEALAQVVVQMLQHR